MGKNKILWKSLGIGTAIVLLAAMNLPVQAFADYKTSEIAGENRIHQEEETSEAMPTGHIASPVDQSYYNYKNTARPRSGNASLPAKYDLRNQERATVVKNQNPWGTCWAFGSLSSAEGNVLKNNSTENLSASVQPDYSERHLAWFAYQTQDDGNGGQEGIKSYTKYPFDYGGNRQMAVGQLSSWSGVEEEAVVPYLRGSSQDWSVSDSKRYDSYARLQNADFLPGTAIFSNPKAHTGYSFDERAGEAVKQALMDNGVVDISYYADQSRPDQSSVNGKYINNKTYAQYTYEYRSSNHEVSIVGWDDQYSKDNFLPGGQPPKDGAWIVKNSWGSNWGLGGYFYLSYYDQSIVDFTSFHMELPDSSGAYTYDNNYQYDFLGLKSPTYRLPSENGGTPVRVANIFTAEEDEELRAVSVLSMDPGSKVDIKIYKVLSSDNPEDKGTLLWESKNLVMKYGGYHTVELDQPISLKKGEKFSIVQCIKGARGYYMPLEADMNGAFSGGGTEYKAFVTAYKGQSFLDNGDGWFDLSERPIILNRYRSGNVMIKAFTTDLEELPKEAPLLKSLQIQSLDSQKDSIGEDLLFDEITQEKNVIELPQYTAFIYLKPMLEAQGITEITIEGTTYNSDAPIPRAEFENKTIKLTTKIKQDSSAIKNWEFQFTVPPTILSDNQVTLTDNNSTLPQVEFKVNVCDRGDASYEWLQEALRKYGIKDQFMIYHLSTKNHGVAYSLTGAETVNIKIPNQDEYNEERTRLLLVDLVEDGTGSVNEIAPAKEGYLEGAVQHIGDSYYAVAVLKNPSLSQAVLPEIKERTDTSITILTAEGQEYSIDDGNMWQKEDVFSGLNPGQEYRIITRNAETEDTLPGEASVAVIVTTKFQPVPPEQPVVNRKTDTEISLQFVEGQEYSIKKSEADEFLPWQEDSTFTGLNPAAVYDIMTRVKATTDAVESSPAVLKGVMTKFTAPQPPDSPEILYIMDNCIVVRQIPGQEYSIDGGESWQTEGTFQGLFENTSYFIITRISETDDMMGSGFSEASQAMTVDTDSVPLSPEVLRYSDRSIEVLVLDGFEYAIKEAGQPEYLHWQEAGLFEGLNPGSEYHIVTRAKGDEQTEPGSISQERSQRTKNSAPPAPGQPEIIGKTDHSIDVRAIVGQVYSIDMGESWQKSGLFAGLNPGTQYSIYTKIVETDDTMESEVSNAATVSSKSRPEIPKSPKLVSRTERSITVEYLGGQEYSIDNGIHWQKSGNFAGLEANKTYRIITRLIETATAIGTSASEPLMVTTDKRATAVPGAPICKSVTDTVITIVVTAGQEYSINNGGIWQNSGIFGGLKENTSYNIITRVKETSTGKLSGASKPLTVKTKSKPLVQKKYKVTFNPNGGKLSTKSKNVIYGSTYGSLPSPVKQKYILKGWYTGKNGGSKITSKTRVSTKKNQTLYARWSKVTPGKVLSVKLANSKQRQLTITIKSVKGANGYQILYGTNSTITKGKKMLTSTSSKKTILKLSKGRTYYVKVRAYQKDSAGGKIYGGYSSVRKVKIIR